MVNNTSSRRLKHLSRSVSSFRGALLQLKSYSSLKSKTPMKSRHADWENEWADIRDQGDLITKFSGRGISLKTYSVGCSSIGMIVVGLVSCMIAMPVLLWLNARYRNRFRRKRLSETRSPMTADC
jgi:hypothetical protein